MASIRRHRASAGVPPGEEGHAPAAGGSNEVAAVDHGHVIPSTRTASAWAAVAVGVVLMVVLLVFIVQNLKTVRVSFLSLHWKIPLAIDLLFATVLGGLIVLTAGSLRILQLRRLARHHAVRGGSDTEPGSGA